MGVLEDAIREHLDLKRRHGASDAELNQQEAEALGPARRDQEPDADAELPAVDIAEHDAAEEEIAAPEVDESAVVEDEAVEAEPPEAALPTAGPEAPPAPADEDTALYAPGDAPAPPEADADLDFGDDRPERGPQRDFDFD
jgi:hypothetical protein